MATYPWDSATSTDHNWQFTSSPPPMACTGDAGTHQQHAGRFGHGRIANEDIVAGACDSERAGETVFERGCIDRERVRVEPIWEGIGRRQVHAERQPLRWDVRI